MQRQKVINVDAGKRFRCRNCGFKLVSGELGEGSTIEIKCVQCGEINRLYGPGKHKKIDRELFDDFRCAYEFGKKKCNKLLFKCKLTKGTTIKSRCNRCGGENAIMVL